MNQGYLIDNNHLESPPLEKVGVPLSTNRSSQAAVSGILQLRNQIRALVWYEYWLITILAEEKLPALFASSDLGKLTHQNSARRMFLKYREID